jgi:4-hydroxybutyrate dehydrogenase/sulfolactaldehyde 3-reductase
MSTPENRSNPADPSSATPDHIILFVGLGTMGLPMATNLVKAGFDVVGHDRNPAAVSSLVAAGGRASIGLAAALREADVVVTMLPDDAIVDQVLGGEDGVVAQARPGALLIEMSTTAPATKIAHASAAAARGIDFVEAPVGKTMDAAIAGTLTLMAGGDAAHIDRARPILAPMGNELHVCGAVGTASAMKLINNALVACINAASIEALVAGRKANLDLGLMLGVFKSTMAWNNALAVGLPRKALRRDFRPGFMTKLAHKDVGLALSMARALDVPMTQGEAAYAILEEALREGYGADDNPGSMLRVCESKGGVELSL